VELGVSRRDCFGFLLSVRIVASKVVLGGFRNFLRHNQFWAIPPEAARL
jgi:hypothetical protein